MSIKRYENTGEIIGQFLPKIYTRRITLESMGNDPEDGRTAVTVDYQIKDILDQNGLGIITQTRKDVIEGGKMVEEDMQDDILKALKVIVIAISDRKLANADRLANQLYTLSNSPRSRGKNFEQALDTLIRGYRGLTKIEKRVVLARPPAIGFEFRNTIYQEYDINNNVINVIPGEQSFVFENKEWHNLDNLSMICFSYFDFESLGLTTDNFSEEDARKLSFTIGDLTIDTITRGGRIVSTANVYKIAETGEPYYGPVHYHGPNNRGPDNYTGYMAGYAGSDMGPKLNRVQVPITKIQDFRAMQRTKLVNYQPAQLEYFNNRKPDISFLDRGDKNFFGLSRVIVNYDKEEQEANIEFTANMFDIFKRNSRYYPLLESSPILGWIAPTLLMNVLEIKIVRRRMTTGLSGTGRLGNKKRVAFMPESEEEHIVISSSDSAAIGTLNPASDDYYGTIEQSNRGFSTRTFKVSDFEIGNYHGTNGIYQYGVEMRIADNTKPFILTKLERARRAIKDLKIYSQESKIPVFDTYNVRKPEENAPIGLAEDPTYTQSISTIGNYNTKTRTFTTKFIKESKTKYDFKEYINSFRDLLFYSFGRRQVRRTRRASETVQLENQLQTPLSALESLRSGGHLPDPESITQTELYNMVNPSNTNPETIDSFITSFEDLVLEMEEYFGANHNFYISSEGSGYSSKSNYSFTVKRWLNSTNFDIDIDTMIHLEPFRDEVAFDYDIARPSYTGVRAASLPDFALRMLEETQRYDIPASNPVAVSPRSLYLGNWVVCFDTDFMKKKKRETELEIKQADQKQAASRRKRRGRRRPSFASKWQRKRRKLAKRKFIYLDPASRTDSDSISNFVTGLKKLSNVRGPSSPTNFLKSIESLTTANFFEGVRAINDQLSNNITNYGALINSTTLVDIQRQLVFPENPNECGLVDNTPKDFRLPFATDFLQREDFFFGFGFAQQDLVTPVLPDDLPEVEPAAEVLPPVTTIEPPSGVGLPGPNIELPGVPVLPDFDIGVTTDDLIPQVRSDAFPTGGIFEDAPVFIADSASGGVLTFADVTAGGLGAGKVELISADVLTGNGVGSPMGSQVSTPSAGPLPVLMEPSATPTPSYGVMDIASPTSSGASSGASFGVSTGVSAGVTAPVAAPAANMNLSVSTGGGFAGTGGYGYGGFF